ncbi:hypothetical protein OBBRIDRAFT_470158 [Obba rivulosa]|uniref:Uncharacterized protein n=1 Tax=Obba rivulosa TaxID=1052685 RepID=A0A8E2B1L7_9APHY|nr:hypothetical protein OBBRIDRAFT_470158 [Obba rivulosa]
MSTSEKVDDSIKVEPLKHKHLPKAVRTVRDALKGDPLDRYFKNTPDSDRASFGKGRQLIAFTLTEEPYIRKKQTLTVNGGDAIVHYRRAPNDQMARNPLDRALDEIAKLAIKELRLFDSAEQKKRKAEFIAKHQDALNAMDDDVNEMSLRSLATVPSKQRRGYGSKLVRASGEYHFT